MGRNTNALFWIICGAIFVTSVYIIIVEADLGKMINSVFSDTNKMVQTADDGSTPGKPVYKSGESTESEFTVKFSAAANTTRYRCNYGTEKGRMRSTGVVYVDKDIITCKSNHLESGTKYYIELVAQNLDKATPSDIATITTK